MQHFSNHELFARVDNSHEEHIVIDERRQHQDHFEGIDIIHGVESNEEKS